MKRLLLLGSSGYLGSNLKCYLKSKYDLIESKRKAEDPNYFTFNENYSDNLPCDLSGIIIAIGSTEQSNNAYQQSLSSSVLTVCNLIDKISQHQNNKLFIIYMSTFQVYGATEGYLSEKTVENPKNIYSLVHLHAEQVLTLYCESNNIKLIKIRPTNIFGTLLNDFPMRRRTLVPNCFIDEALTLNKIEVKAKQCIVRDFIHIKDVCKLVDLCVQYLLAENKIVNVLKNASSGNIYRISEVAYITKQVIDSSCNSDIELIIGGSQCHIDPYNDFNSNLFVDTLTLGALNWSPENSLLMKDAIANLLSLYKKNTLT